MSVPNGKTKFLKKKTAALIVYSKPRFQFATALNTNSGGLILRLTSNCTAQAVVKKKEPITAFLICVLSALRLCVWRFDNGYIKLFNINQTLALTFWTKKRKVFENGIFSDFVACFITTNRTTDRICFFYAYHFTFRSVSFFLFSSRYFRMILFLTGLPTPKSKTTAKIV